MVIRNITTGKQYEVSEKDFYDMKQSHKNLFEIVSNSQPISVGIQNEEKLKTKKIKPNK